MLALTGSIAALYGARLAALFRIFFQRAKPSAFNYRGRAGTSAIRRQILQLAARVSGYLFTLLPSLRRHAARTRWPRAAMRRRSEATRLCLFDDFDSQCRAIRCHQAFEAIAVESCRRLGPRVHAFRHAYFDCQARHGDKHYLARDLIASLALLDASTITGHVGALFSLPPAPATFISANAEMAQWLA